MLAVLWTNDALLIFNNYSRTTATTCVWWQWQLVFSELHTHIQRLFFMNAPKVVRRFRRKHTSKILMHIQILTHRCIQVRFQTIKNIAKAHKTKTSNWRHVWKWIVLIEFLSKCWWFCNTKTWTMMYVCNLEVVYVSKIFID